MVSERAPLQAARQRDSSTKTLPLLPQHVAVWSKFKRRCRKLFRCWWAWEVSAAVLSIGATVALVVVLAKSDGQQQQSWRIANTQLTLNTVVAIISTVIRASLLVTVAGALNQSPWNWFANRRHNNSSHPRRKRRTGDILSPQPASDRADGGMGRPLEDMDIFGEAAFSSWGSLKLLYRTKLRYLAALGALITILSLAFDAFTQQGLTTKYKRGYFDTTRTTSYLGAFQSLFENGDFLPDNVTLPLSAESTLLNGILGTNGSQPTASCSTGNCTWPTTPTMGLCSSCTDVKSQLIANDNDHGVEFALPHAVFNNSILIANATSPVSVSLPGNFDDIFTLAAGFPQPAKLGRLSLIDFITLGLPPSSISTFVDTIKEPLNKTLYHELVVAHPCSIWYCLQAWNATSTNGIVQQELVGSWDQMNGTGVQDLSGTPFALQYYFVGPPTSLNVDDPSLYRTDHPSTSSLQDTLQDILTGHIALNSDLEQPSFGTPDNTFGGSVSLEAIWMGSKTSSTMASKVKHIADTYTAYMRTAYTAAPAARYAPTVLREITTSVRWPWLAYPLALLVAGHVFFVATLIQTHRHAVRPWKSQRLPLILADVDDIIKEFAPGGCMRAMGWRSAWVG